MEGWDPALPAENGRPTQGVDFAPSVWYMFFSEGIGPDDIIRLHDMKYTLRNVGLLIDLVAAKDPACEVLQYRPTKVISRIAIAHDRTIILKLWPRAQLRHLPKQLLRRTHPYREWRANTYLAQHAIRVPEVYAFVALPRGMSRRFGHAMCMEDLGARYGNADRHCKNLLRSGALEELAAAENAILDLTRRMLRAKAIDVDHRMANVYVSDDRQLVKIDLESVRPSWNPVRHPEEVALMFGHLMSSFAYAFPTDKERVNRFAARVLELTDDRRVRRLAFDKAMELLRRHHRVKGVEPILSDSLRPV